MSRKKIFGVEKANESVEKANESVEKANESVEKANESVEKANESVEKANESGEIKNPPSPKESKVEVKEKLYTLVFKENRKFQLNINNEFLTFEPYGKNPVYPEKYQKGVGEDLIKHKDFLTHKDYFVIKEA